MRPYQKKPRSILGRAQKGRFDQHPIIGSLNEPPSAPTKEPEHFIDARPPRLRQGGEYARLTHFHRTETRPTLVVAERHGELPRVYRQASQSPHCTAVTPQ